MPIDKDEDISLKSNTTAAPTHGGELPHNRTNIDESALYEHATDKQNNQSERAFIYINQKYKKPSSHHNYFKIGQSISEYIPSYPQSKPQAILLQRYNEPCKSEPAQVNNYFQGFDYIRTQDTPSYFGSSTLFNCNNEPLTFNYKDNIDTRIEPSYNGYNHIPNDDRRDYIELLKAPLLRSLSRGRAKYDVVPASHLSPVRFHDFLKLDQVNNQHNPKANILVNERKNEPRRNYGFNSAFGPQAPQAPHQNKGLMHRIEEPHFDGDFVNDDESSLVASIEKAQDDDKLLDQYLKDTLEDQVTSKEKPVIPTDCRYRDCNLHSAKPSSSGGHQKITKNPDCKCGQRSKQNEAPSPKERQEREENKRNQTNMMYQQPPQQSDITYYETMMNGDPSNIKRGHDLISKLNNTLYH